MSQQAGSSGPPLPWYRQFWPWFLIALLFAAVLASFALLYFALREPDSLVKDDWYQDGKMINRVFARDDRARALGLRASMEISTASNVVVVQLHGKGLEKIEALRLELAHPTQAARDQVIRLHRRGTSEVFYGNSASSLAGRWYATLTPFERGMDNGWRLARRIELPAATAISFEPGGH